MPVLSLRNGRRSKVKLLRYQKSQGNQQAGPQVASQAGEGQTVARPVRLVGLRGRVLQGRVRCLGQ